MLSDGFNETELEAYRNDILEVDEVQKLKVLKGVTMEVVCLLMSQLLS